MRMLFFLMKNIHQFSFIPSPLTVCLFTIFLSKKKISRVLGMLMLLDIIERKKKIKIQSKTTLINRGNWMTQKFIGFFILEDSSSPLFFFFFIHQLSDKRVNNLLQLIIFCIYLSPFLLLSTVNWIFVFIYYTSWNFFKLLDIIMDDIVWNKEVGFLWCLCRHKIDEKFNCGLQQTHLI